MAKSYKYKVVKSKKGDFYLYGPSGSLGRYSTRSEVNEAIKRLGPSTAKYKPGVAKTAKKAATKSKHARIKANRKILIDKRGHVINKAWNELINNIQNDPTISVGKKASYIDWLEHNRKTSFAGTNFAGRKHLSVSSAIGLLTSNSIALMLYNTGYGVDELVSELNSNDDNITSFDLTNDANWSGLTFTSPTTGFKWKFEFKYNGFPFTRIS